MRGVRVRAGLGFAPGGMPSLGSDYGSETPYGGLGLGATPSVQSGAPADEVKPVRAHLLYP